MVGTDLNFWSPKLSVGGLNSLIVYSDWQIQDVAETSGNYNVYVLEVAKEMLMSLKCPGQQSKPNNNIKLNHERKGGYIK